jgi:hypothetical protein
MQTRYRAAATALLMTATAGMAATGGAAEASGMHHAGKAAKSLTVTIRSTGTGPKVMADKIRPGFTTFKVERKAKGNGAIQLFRLKRGYSLKDLKQDLPKITSETVDVKAVRRIDRNVVFYGGGDVSKKTPVAKWAVDIDKAGRYYVANTFRGQFTSFLVKGKHQRRSHPTADGTINAAAGNVWKVSSALPEKGWIKTTNHATEPHFVGLDPVDQGATDQDVADWFADPTSGPPPIDPDRSSFIGTEVVSPGHTVYWKFASEGGRYIVDCFFPSKVDGMPHAFMGMFLVTVFGPV